MLIIKLQQAATVEVITENVSSNYLIAFNVATDEACFIILIYIIS